MVRQTTLKKAKEERESDKRYTPQMNKQKGKLARQNKDIKRVIRSWNWRKIDNGKGQAMICNTIPKGQLEAVNQGTDNA